MINFFANNTTENLEDIQKIFNSSHDIQSYISNYTIESFYYKYLNRFLREGNLDFFRILSNHISKFIYHLYEYRKKIIHTQVQSNLYRQMYIDKKDLEVYFKSVGKVICYPSFTSTSIKEGEFSPTVFAKEEDVLVKLIIEQNNSKSVVSIKEFSKHPDEEEYLFLPFSFFKITGVKKCDGNANNPHKIFLTAIDSEKPIEDIFLNYMENETDNLDPEGLDMLKIYEAGTKIKLNPSLLSKNYLYNKRLSA